LLAGDSHVFGVMDYSEGGKEKTAINCGTLQTNSGYAQRFFSLTTHPIFPCVVLWHDTRKWQALKSVKTWLELKR